MYQGSKLKNNNRRGSFWFWPQSYFSLWPLRKPKDFKKGDEIIIKNGNKALKYFWILFLLIMIQTVVYFSLKEV